VAGLTYENPSAGLAFSVPSFAWRYDPAPAAEPQDAVVAARFSPEGQGLAILRVRIVPGVREVAVWAKARESAADSVGGRTRLSLEAKRLGGRVFVLSDVQELKARVFTAYTVEADRGVLLEFRADPAAYAALAREFVQILESVELR
jgi:hypothetical protein